MNSVSDVALRKDGHTMLLVEYNSRWIMMAQCFNIAESYHSCLVTSAVFINVQTTNGFGEEGQTLPWHPLHAKRDSQ
jgi:hypothetical protein